jgi:hypothetical protein
MNTLAGPLDSPPPYARPWRELARDAVAAVVALLGAVLVYVMFSPALVVLGLVLLWAGRARRGTAAGRWLTAVGAFWLALGLVGLAQLSVHIAGSTSHPVRVEPPVAP